MEAKDQLKLTGISKTFPGQGEPAPVLEEISLTVGKGEFVTLIGPSGSGKSTLFSYYRGAGAAYLGARVSRREGNHRGKRLHQLHAAKSRFASVANDRGQCHYGAGSSGSA